MLSDDVIEAYYKAGKIAAETRTYARGLVKEGTSLIGLCTAVEETIISKGGRPAFPCNIDVNEVAAHYSSPIGDNKIIPKGALVKVDLGVQVDGYIADTAVTVSLDPVLDSMVLGVDEALKEAILTIRPRVKNGDVGRTIENVIERYGFRPIENLSGHQMTRFVLHTGKTIPNVRGLGLERIIEDEVYAVEPFLTLRRAKGSIRADNDEIYIYRHHKEKRLRSTEAKKLLDVIRIEFKSLPFSQRWLKNILPPEELNVAFKELVDEKCVVGYPILIEESGQIVAQAEHTLIVTKDGCMVTTL